MAKIHSIACLARNLARSRNPGVARSMEGFSMYMVKVADLPNEIQAALQAVGYHKVDVGIQAKDRVCLQDFGATGCRSFVALLNLDTNERRTLYGSWGGPGLGSAGNPIDLDGSYHTLPENGCVIEGREGGGRPVSASITVHPSRLATMLPAGPTVTEQEAAILYAYRSLKSGPYRQEALARLGVRNNYDETIGSLIARGLLKRFSNGATAITTAGKNACAHVRHKGY